MRPNIFETSNSLIKFIENLPVVAGNAKDSSGLLLDAATVIAKLKVLAPRMFRYKEILAKSPGGLGNLKSVRRFSDAAAFNISDETHAQYEEALNELGQEVEALMNMGVSEETVEQLSRAKSQIAQFEYMKSSIMGFKSKLQSRMANVEGAAQNMANALSKVVKTSKDASIADSLKMAQGKLQSDLKEIIELTEAMNEYCDLQVVYNSIWIGASNRRSA